MPSSLQHRDRLPQGLPQEAYAYALDEINTILAILPEPASSTFATAVFVGLRHGEIYVSRSIWNGRINHPKTRKGRALVSVIRQLAQRLEMHRFRCGNPQNGIPAERQGFEAYQGPARGLEHDGVTQTKQVCVSIARCERRGQWNTGNWDIQA